MSEVPLPGESPDLHFGVGSGSAGPATVPDIPHPITGFRHFTRHGDELHSGQGYLWSPGVNRTRAPGDGFAGGFHAFHDADSYELSKGDAVGNVFGAILAWGEMEVSSDRFRAEYARVIGLEGKGKEMEALADNYRVPLFAKREDLMAEVDRHGRSLDQSARPAGMERHRDASAPNLKLSAEMAHHVPAGANVSMFSPGQSPRMWPELPHPHLLAPFLFGAVCFGLAEVAKVVML